MWCRRGDSNPHELPHTPLKRARLPVPPLRLVREGCQRFKVRAGYFLVGAFDGCVAAAGDAEGTDDASGVTCAVATGDGEGSGCCSGTPDCKTERVPVIIGSDNTKANNMKPAAAPIVILDKIVCVPLGPNAVLETELENSAPASDLPG